MPLRFFAYTVFLLLVLGVSPTGAQSPSETLRDLRAEARALLQREQNKSAAAWERERKTSSATLEELRTELKEALAGWMHHGNRTPQNPPANASTAEGPKVTSEEKSPSGSSSAPTRSETGPSAASAASESTGSGASASEIETERAPAHAVVPSNRRRRAAPYRSLLDRYARRRDLPRTLLYAIADAESYWDSSAVSHAGAVGLLQVHPPTGGRLSYSVVHGEPWTPTREYLTSPENNVRLATKLLELLLTRYFGGVQHPWTRQLIAVAAYNAGASRVAQGLTDAGTLEAAVVRANALTPRQMYERLRRTTPDETREYVRRVFARRAYYWAWKKAGERVYGVPSSSD